MNLHRVTNMRNLSDSAYVLCFERKNIVFIPGQHLNIGLPEEENRPYSIYNGVYDKDIEILVKEVTDGNISRKLKRIKIGDNISADKACGEFTIENEMKDNVPFWFIATGTGISPYHSFVLSYPDINYRIIHGIRYSNESYEHHAFRKETYFSCTSRDTAGNFNGRITEYLERTDLDMHAYYYICGGYEMIDQVYDLLISRGISKVQLKTEGYF